MTDATDDMEYKLIFPRGVDFLFNDEKANDIGAAFMSVQKEVRDRLKQKKWKTKEGEELLISNMGTQHIVHTVNMLRRRGAEESDVGSRYIDLFNEEIDRRAK